MKDATYELGKHRVYECSCGAKPCRPLQAVDTTYRPWPKPCDRCGQSLVGRPYSIEDTGRWTRETIAEAKKGER